MSRTKITIKDIAKAAGVSTTTVSLVLNNKPSRISKETREKILKIAKDEKYIPNRLAVNLAKQTTDTFGMIIPDIGNVFFAELCKGCEVEAREAGYSLTFASANEYISTDLEYVDAMIANRVDGIIYVSSSSTDSSTNQKICQKIHNSQIPFVVVDRSINFPYAKSVLMDNEAGGYIATKHLLELGHHKIGCLTGPMQSDTSKKRLAGYKKALNEFNISYDSSLIMEGNFQIESGYECLSYMRGLGVTAIFCFNDMMALGVYKAARDYGLKIPRDISVVGYDDIFICDILDVPLTTVHQPAYSIGRYAVQTLLALIRKDKDVENIVLSPSLKVRASTRRL